MLTGHIKKRTEKVQKKERHLESSVCEDGKKLTADEWKQRGNELFDKRRLSEAAACYSRALDMKPEQPVYFTNRALCYLREGKWDMVIRDCRAAMQRDPFFVKAWYLMGIALMEKDAFDEALQHLNTAFDYSKASRLFFGDEIPLMIRTCRKRRWDKLESKRLEAEHELYTYVSNLINAEKNRRLQRSDDETAAVVDDEIHTQIPQSFPLSNNDMIHYHDNQRAALNRLFAQADERRRRRDVPDFLCGRIGFELIREPVITPSGITYERKDILEHLRRVGHFDPVTRHKLTQDQLIPNLAMKEVVDAFLAENEWAIDY